MSLTILLQRDTSRFDRNEYFKIFFEARNLENVFYSESSKSSRNVHSIAILY